jgi:hypothetical protein
VPAEVVEGEKVEQAYPGVEVQGRQSSIEEASKDARKVPFGQGVGCDENKGQ